MSARASSACSPPLSLCPPSSSGPGSTCSRGTRPHRLSSAASSGGRPRSGTWRASSSSTPRSVTSSSPAGGTGPAASLRVRYTQGQPDQRVQALISELIERSPVFRQLWEEHGAVKRMKGRKTFNHPEIGEIELDWDRLTVPGASGQVLMVYSAAPGTPGATALTLLSTLAATAAQPG